MANKTYVAEDTSTPGDWSAAANWDPSGVPGAGDDVRIPAKTTQSITGGLDQSAVALGDVIVEEGYTGTIGSSAGYLQIDPDRCEFDGTGEAWIDLGSANINVQVFDSAVPSTGNRGLYLKGSNIATLSVVKGYVGVAVNHGETSTVATARTVGANASLWLGAGVTLTTVESMLGTCIVRTAATTITVQGGTVTTEETGTVTTFVINGGIAYPNSTGTVTTMTLNGGQTNFTTSGVARTVTTLKQNPDSQLRYDPAVLTITTRAAPDYPILLMASAV